MSITDDIKALREKYPYLSDVPDKDITTKGFLSMPDMLMQKHYDTYKKVQALPSEEQLQRRARAIGQVQKVAPPEAVEVAEAAEIEPIVAPPKQEVPSIEFRLPKRTLINPTLYQDSITSSLDLLKRAKANPRQFTPQEIEAHQLNVENRLESPNMLDYETAKESQETGIWQSLFGILEPFDYLRRAAWYDLIKAGEVALPGPEEFGYEYLKEAAGTLGNAIEYTLADPLPDEAFSVPLKGKDIPILLPKPLLSPYAAQYDQYEKYVEGLDQTKQEREALGLYETLFENLYDAVVTGKATGLAKRSHMNVVPGVDALNIPYISSIDLGNLIMPKETALKLSEEARKKGATQKADELYRLATDDLYRFSLFLMPEIILDPMWFFGPAKAGQVVRTGGKAVLLNDAGVKASRAIASERNLGLTLQEAQALIVNAGLGDAEALGRTEAVLETIRSQAKAYEAASADFLKAAQSENAVEAANKVITDNINEVVRIAEAQTDLAKAILANPRSTAAERSFAEQTVENVRRTSIVTVESLKNTAATFNNAKNAETLLKTASKKQAANYQKASKEAENLAFVVQALKEGTKDADKIARINAGYSLHIPFTNRDWNVNINPFYRDGLKMRPKQGDTVLDIANRTGIDEIDLAHINGFKGPNAIADLQAKINKGEDIIFQLGKNPISGSEIVTSLLPGGLAYNFTKGLWKEPLIRVLETAGVPRGLFDPVDMNRIQRLEKADIPLTTGDQLTKWFYTGTTGKLAKGYTHGKDIILKMLGSRWAQPWLASEKLQKALRYMEERSIKSIKDQGLTVNENALINLQKVAPELWNNYVEATKTLFQKYQVYSDEIDNFISRISRNLIEIASKRGDDVKPLDIMDEIANAREAGTIDRLSAEEKFVSDELQKLLSSISNKVDVKNAEEVVQQSLIAMARFVDKDKVSKIKALNELRRLSLMLGPVQTTATKEVRQALSKKIKKIRDSLRTKKVKADPERVKEIQDEIQAIQNIRAELNKRNLAIDAADFENLKLEEQTKIRSIETKTKELLEQIEKQKEILGDTTKVELATPAGAFSKSGTQLVYNRQLLNWEQELFTEYHAVLDGINAKRVQDGLEPMSQESMMKATLAVLNTAPSALKDKEAFTAMSARYAFRDGQVGAVPPLDDATARAFQTINDEIDEILSIPNPTPQQVEQLKRKRQVQDQLILDTYIGPEGTGGFVPQVVGQRFGQALDPELETIRQSFDQMFDKYEKLYRTRGFDFVKDPFERMRIWGVVDYIPHARTDLVNPIVAERSRGLVKTPQSMQKIEDRIWNSSSKGSLDRELSFSMDQAKKRVIGGTIMEINALPKGDNLNNWVFSANPIALAAHFKNASKAIANVDLLTTYLKTGVIRTFDTLEDAAARQYVPLFEYGSYAREVQILAKGNANEIRQLISESGSPNEVLAQYRQLLREAQENGNHLGGGKAPERVMRSWVDDIKQIRAVDSVEQSLTGINLYAVNKGLDPIDVTATFNTRMAERTAEARREIETKINTYNRQVAAYEKQVETLEAGTKEAKKAAKQLAKARRQLEKTAQKLQEDQAQYKSMLRRIEDEVWQSLTEDINNLVAVANNETNALLRVVETTGRLPNIDIKSLKMYMAPNQEMFRLYVPATVQESLTRLVQDVAPKTTLGATVKYYADFILNLWKSRVTIVATAFTARNVVGNIFSNALDVGIGGALNIDTNYKAWALGSLVDYHARYGSIDNAIEALTSGIRENLVEGAKKVAEGAKRRARFDSGMDTPTQLLRQKADLELLLSAFNAKKSGGQTLVDLGDGRLLTLDEHLKQAQRFGVINGSSTFRADVNQVMYEYEKLARDMCLAEATGEAKYAKAWDTFKKSASIGEDVVYTTLPFMLGAPGVAIPKWLGRTISRRAENQGRMVNYIANLKRGRTPEEAAAQVDKFLFDYSDLSQWQKVWMRSLIPFFTWNYKNVLLHAEMMQSNPQYYAQFYKFFYITLPELVETVDREQREQDGGELPEERAYDLTAERIKKSPVYKAYRVTVPFDPKNRIFIEGLGLPLESYAQNVGSLGTIFAGIKNGYKSAFGDVQPRNDWMPVLSPYMAQTHVLGRALIEGTMDVDIFRGQSIRRGVGANDIKFMYQQANDIGNLVHQLYLNNGYDAETPKDVQDLFMQGKGPWFAQYIMNTLDIQVAFDPKNGVQHYYVPTGKVNALRLLRLLPAERMIREAVTVNDLNGTMMSTPENIMSGESTLNVAELAAWRAGTAFTGVRLKQDISDELMKEYFENRTINLQLDYQVRPDNIGR
jgi:hypothetical protein